MRLGMKRVFLGAVSLMVLGALAPAGAADLAARPYTKAPMVAPAPLPTWTGFYIGLQGGGGWGTSKETFIGRFNAPGFLGTQNYNTNGGFAGGVIGYNWQVDNIVFGLEGDYHWADINGRSGVITAGLGDSYFTKLRGFGDIKGRLGYAVGPALFFVSGGAAVGELQHRYDRAAGVFFGQNTTRWGYTVGAGAEYMFAPNWSAKAEYQYYNFGNTTFTGGPAPVVGSRFNSDEHTVKVGVNYRFGWSGPTSKY